MILTNGANQPLAPQAFAETAPLFFEGYFVGDQGLQLETRFATYAQLYLSQPWVATVVNKIASSIARLGVRVWDTSNPDQNVLQTSSPYAKLMAGPCATLDPYSFWNWLASTIEVYGEAFLIKVRNARGQVEQFIPMHPALTQMFRDQYGGIQYRFMGQPNEILSEDMVVPFVGYNPNMTQRGVSRMEPLRSTLMNEDSSRRAIAGWWKNMGRPSGVVTVEGKLDPEGRKRLREQWNQMYAGSENAGATAVLENGSKFQQIQLNAEEMQYIESRKLNREEVCFPPGTRVVTDDGMRRIEDIRVGDRVLTHAGRFRSVYSTMNRPYDGDLTVLGSKSLNTVRVTSNHPFYVQNIAPTRSGKRVTQGAPEWVVAGDVAARRRALNGKYATRGAYQALTIPRLQSESVQVVDVANWARETSVITSDKVFGGKNGRAVGVTRHIKTDTDLAWLAGLFIADGTAHDHQMTIYLGAHEADIAARAQVAIRSVFGIDSKIKDCGNIIRVTVSSRPVTDFFSQFGRGAQNKHLVDWCMESDNDFKHALIEGLVTGDGHINGGYTCLTTVSEHLSWQVRLLLWSLSIGSSVAVRRRSSSTIEGRCVNSVDSFTVQWRTHCGGRYQHQTSDDVAYFTVTNAESEHYRGTVFNLSVTDDESYVTEGGTVHNCAAYDIPPPAVHILDRATFCLPADAQISTESGPRSIVDVRPGDRVWSYDGTQIGLAGVSWSGKTGELPLFTVRTANRELRATGNHPVLVARRPYVSGRGNRTHYGDPEFVWIRVDELAEGDLLVAGHGYATSAKRENAPNGRPVTTGLMEFCGLLAGDGTVNAGSISIAHAKDARYIGRYREAAESLFSQRDGAIKWHKQSDRSSRFASASAARELRELGFGGGAHTKSVPEWVFECSDELRLAFLRGILEADGSVDKKGRVSFTLCNLRMVRQVRDMMIGLGIPVTNLRTATRDVVLPTGKPFTATAHTFVATDPGHNRRISSHDERDLQRLNDGAAFNPIYYRYADRTGRVIEPPIGAQLTKIKSITASSEPVPVYDLTVPGVHNFVADGVVVHNSNISEQMRSLYRDSLAPRLEFIESVMNWHVGSEFNGAQNMRFDVSDVMRGDFEHRAQAYSQLVQVGIAKPSEARPHFDLDDAGPDANQLYANSALQPLGAPPPSAGRGSEGEASSRPAGPAVPDDTARKYMRDLSGRMGGGQSLETAARELAAAKPDDEPQITQACAAILEKQL